MALPLQPGWIPTRLLIGPSEVSILQLRHISGQAATWFMDGNFRFMTNSFTQLTDHSRAAIIDLIAGLPNIAANEIASSFSDLSARVASIRLDDVRLFNTLPIERLIYFCEFWRDNDYLVIPGALTGEAIQMLKERISFDRLNQVSEENQFYRVHHDESSTDFIFKFLQISVSYYQTLLSTDLVASYGFAMKYIRNSDMHPHYDNYNNPISSTICYHSSPESLKNPLYLDRARFSNPYPWRLTVKDREGIPLANVVRLDLQPGDIAIFRGRSHLHWRDTIRDELDYRALLLHFCDYEYKGTVGHGSPVPNITKDQVFFDSYDEFRRTHMMYFEKNRSTWI
jgi:hypothetical protein